MSDKSPFPKTVKAGVPRLSNLPAGWAKAPLKAFLTEVKRPAKIKSGDLYNLITVKRARGGVEHRSQLLGREILVKSQFFVKTGDFVISKRQIVHGACGLVQAEQDGAIVSNEYVVFSAKENFDLSFLQYLSESLYFQQTCFHSSIGVHIEKMLFKTEKWLDWPFNIPPLPEQIKIAEILSTWDNAINTVQKLLANSQQQKKALMQQLLTGKKRFAEFDGEWEKVKLKSLGRCLTGLTYSPDDVVENGILVLRSSNIQSGKLSFADNVYVNKVIEEKNKTRYGDILVCIRNGSRNLIGKTAFIKEEGCGQTHGAFMALFRGNHSEYVFQLFQSHAYYKQVSQNLGATINSINTSDLHEFIFFMPSNKLEIEKIATILTTADREIDNLRAQLNHLKQEKKALMQQLLTGKRRVRIDEVA